MKLNQLKNQEAYLAKFNGQAGLLVYFYVYTFSWCWAPYKERDKATAYVPVTEADIESMTIKKAL